jgi:hypothetical protein
MSAELNAFIEAQCAALQHLMHQKRTNQIESPPLPPEVMASLNERVLNAKAHASLIGDSPDTVSFCQAMRSLHAMYDIAHFFESRTDDSPTHPAWQATLAAVASTLLAMLQCIAEEASRWWGSYSRETRALFDRYVRTSPFRPVGGRHDGRRADQMHRLADVLLFAMRIGPLQRGDARFVASYREKLEGVFTEAMNVDRPSVPLNACLPPGAAPLIPSTTLLHKVRVLAAAENTGPEIRRMLVDARGYMERQLRVLDPDRATVVMVAGGRARDGATGTNLLRAIDPFLLQTIVRELMRIEDPP